MSRPTFFVLPLFALGIAALTFACGGSIDGSTSRGTDPTSPGGSSSTGGSRSGNGPGSARPEPCEGTAQCPDGSERAYSCPANGSGCEVHYVCGTPVYCQRGYECDGYPECDPGHTKVASSTQCLQDDALCYQRSTCGVTIWCTGPIVTDAGTPDASFPPPPPPPNP